MKLVLEPNIDDADGFYDELLEVHRDLTKAESDGLNARLILVLANHIGNRDVLKQAFAVARNDRV